MLLLDLLIACCHVHVLLLLVLLQVFLICNSGSDQTHPPVLGLLLPPPLQERCQG